MIPSSSTVYTVVPGTDTTYSTSNTCSNRRLCVIHIRTRRSEFEWLDDYGFDVKELFSVVNGDCFFFCY